MATGVAYEPLNMAGNVWYGVVIAASSTEIILTDGFVTGRYGGFGFSYVGNSIVSGTLTSYTEYHGNFLAGEFYNFSVPAPLAAAYINSNNLLGLFAIALAGNDYIETSAFADYVMAFDGNDTIFASGGDDVVLGGAGRDVISGGTGFNYIDGGAGVDMAVYGASRFDFLLSKDGSSIFVDGGAGLVHDQTVSVERFGFVDGLVAFDQIAAQSYRLYQAAFDRTPDVGGLSFWVARADGGMSLRTTAANFIASAEFQALYGKNPSNTQFVDLLYENVLNRSPDAGGYAFWLTQMGNGMSRADVLVHFSESAENQANVIGAIANGIWLDPTVA